MKSLIDIVPSDWFTQQIRFFSDTYSGGTPLRSNEKFYSGKINWVKSSELKNKYLYDTEEHITEEAINKSSARYVDPDTILFAMYGATAGDICILKTKATTNQAVLAIPINKNNIENEFLYYSLMYKTEKLKYITQGGGQPNLSKGIIDKTPISYPKALNEQKAIAGILTKVDNAIEAVKKSIKEAEKLKQSLMQHLLTGKLKPDGTWRSETELFMTKYGYAPKTWRYCQIRDLIKEEYIKGVQDGNHGESHPVSEEFVSEGIPFVMASNISDGYIDVKNCKKITKDRADKLRIGFAKNGDVLLSHKASVGYTCIVEDADPYVMLTPQVTYYRVDPSKLTPEYLKLFFQTYSFQCSLEGLAKQSTRNYIGITNQKKMWIYLPENIDEQRKVVGPIIQVDDQILNKKSKIQSLKTLKKSLMQNLLTGKVRVDVEEINKLLEEV
ncbi:MAG: putative type restriction enzyme specificity protein [Neobacillus sp.]|jgi:type I restriction enzyme S subunit|nr:putative type restriction enzyme specificity protein [Neobacillus sp.]